MKVGLVGFGMVAERFHAPLISVEPGLRLTHVVERSRRRAAELYPGIVTLASLEELLASDVEIVVVLTPNESHFAMAQAALQAGKHVVVDKPFTVSTAQADELIALAGEADRLLTVFHNRRWDSDFLTLKSVLQQGCLGTLHRYEQRWERFRPSPKGGWREAEGAGSGVLYDLGSHMLDQALLLFGQPRALFCHLQTQREGTDAVDCFDLILDYGAMQAFLSSNCLSAAPSFRYLVMGEGGSFRKDGLDPQEDALAAGARPAGPGWGEEPEKLWGHLDLLRQGQLERQPVATVAGNYPEFYRNLAMAARGQASLAVGAHQARDVVFALELALASHREGAWRPWSSGPL